MTRLVEMRVADTAAGQSYGGASAGFAERDMSSANADGRRDSAFAEVQANAGEDFDGAVEPEAHVGIVCAFVTSWRSDCTETSRFWPNSAIGEFQPHVAG